jgi:hypothetical protein
MHFNTKNYLKNNYNHIANESIDHLIRLSYDICSKRPITAWHDKSGVNEIAFHRFPQGFVGYAMKSPVHTSPDLLR